MKGVMADLEEKEIAYPKPQNLYISTGGYQGRIQDFKLGVLK